MYKKAYLLLAFLLCAHLVSGQFRVGLGVGVPSGKNNAENQQFLSLKAINDWGVEARVVGRYALTQRVDVGLDLDISSFYGKNELELENANYITGKSALTSSQFTVDYFLLGGQFLLMQVSESG